VEIGNSSHTHFNKILMNSTVQSVAILGGAFDPVHLAHLSLAEDAYREMRLDEVWFVPSAQSPLKDHNTVLGALERLELLEAALRPFPHFKVEKSEIEAGGVSYSIDTVRRLRARFPKINFSWIIGGDQFSQLDKWKDLEELCGILKFIVVSRPGYEVDMAQLPDIPSLRISEVKSRMLDIASSEIREQLATGNAMNDLLPKAVSDLIVERNFYSE
jgi:nicotinate-nucleotide adenylyltransferase